MSLNTLTEQDINKIIADQETRIKRLYDLINGVPIGTVRIADAAITNAKIANLAVTDAKIDSLSVDKLTAGTLSVIADVGDTGDAGYVRLDGEDNNIVIAEDVASSALPRILLGDDGT